MLQQIQPSEFIHAVVPAQILHDDGDALAIAQPGTMKPPDLVVQRLPSHELIIKRNHFTSLDAEICAHFSHCDVWF